MKRLPKNKTAPNFMQLDPRLVFPANSMYVRPIKEDERTSEWDGCKYIVLAEGGDPVCLISEFDQIQLMISEEEVLLYLAH